VRSKYISMQLVCRDLVFRVTAEQVADCIVLLRQMSRNVDVMTSKEKNPNKLWL
jgi:hypothetical protein